MVALDFRSKRLRKKEVTNNKLDCKAGTLRSSKVNNVTSPKDPAASHSGTAAEKNQSHKCKSLISKLLAQGKSFIDKVFCSTSTSCLWL